MWTPARIKSLFNLLTLTAAIAGLAMVPRVAQASASEHEHGAQVEEDHAGMSHGEEGHAGMSHGEEGHAEEGHAAAGHGGHHVVHLDNWFSLSFGPDKEHKNGPFAFAILNFAILLWLLVKFAKQPFRDFLHNRSATVGQDLKDAAELNQQARDKLSQIESKLHSLDQEIQEIKDNVAADAQLEKERIIKDAEAEADRIIKQADLTLDNEVRRAKKTLETEAIGAAMAAAEKLIKQQVNATDHKRLNEEYFSQISSSGGPN